MKNSVTPAKQSESETARQLAGSDVSLPDGSGFDSKPARISFSDALLLNEEYREMMADTAPSQEQRLREKCAVEFVL